MKDSSLTRGCRRTSVVAAAADASSANSTASSSSSSSKRRKVSSPSESELASCALLTGSTEKKVKAPSPAASSLCSDLPALSAPASSSDSGAVVGDDGLSAGDHQEKSFETESSTCINNGNFSREATPSSELCHGGEKRMEAQKFQASSQTAAGGNRVTPPQAEIDEFFSAADKYEQKRFVEKYNYDIVKDVPLQGRYQWVLLKP